MKQVGAGRIDVGAAHASLCLSSKWVILSTWRKEIAYSRFFSETDQGHDLNMNLSM